MLNRAIEIHDSILESVSISPSKAKLTFSSVYVHQSEGKPGLDAGSVWVQKAVLRIDDPEIKDTFFDFPVELGDGQLQMGTFHFNNMIPIPLCYKAAFELRLESMWQAQKIVSFVGSGVELELLGEPKYAGEFRS